MSIMMCPFNTSAPETEHLVYQALIPRFRQTVEHVLPEDAAVLIVSKGDAELLRLKVRHAGHFPQREDGVYPGYYPADSAAAIAQLEALRRKGASFLIFPYTAF